MFAVMHFVQDSMVEIMIQHAPLSDTDSPCPDLTAKEENEGAEEEDEEDEE